MSLCATNGGDCQRPTEVDRHNHPPKKSVTRHLLLILLFFAHFHFHFHFHFLSSILAACGITRGTTN